MSRVAAMRRHRLLVIVVLPLALWAIVAVCNAHSRLWLQPRALLQQLRPCDHGRRVHHQDQRSSGRPAVEVRDQRRIWSRKQAVNLGIMMSAVVVADPVASDAKVLLPGQVSLQDRFRPDGQGLQNPRLGPLAPPVRARCAYPDWMFGEWLVSARQMSFAEPLGGKFLDDETRAALREDLPRNGGGGGALKWRSRYYIAPPEELNPSASAAAKGTAEQLQRPSGNRRATAWPVAMGSSVVQYRAFNAAQEVQAFLGGAEAVDVLAQADPRREPLTILVAVPLPESDDVQTIALRLDACGLEVDGDTFISSELFRQVISINDVTESVGDYEVLNRYTLLDDDRGLARVQNRVLQYQHTVNLEAEKLQKGYKMMSEELLAYLVPGDALYKEFAGRAVSLRDFEWNLTRVSTCIDTPYGKQCFTPA